MAHNARIRPDSKWVTGPPLAGSEITTVDVNLTKAINGDGGGTYTPSAQIVIGGAAGLRLCTATHQLSGAGAIIQTSLSQEQFVEYGDDDYALLDSGHAGASRHLGAAGGEAVSIFNWLLGFSPPASRAPSAREWLALAVHDGATLASVTIGFVVSVHADPPEVLPTFRPLAIDRAGTIYPLATATPGGVVPFSPNPATGVAWHNGGNAQTFTITCDSPGANPRVVVDRSKYAYFVEVIDESGISYARGNGYFDATAHLTSIADRRPY